MGGLPFVSIESLDSFSLFVFHLASVWLYVLKLLRAGPICYLQTAPTQLDFVHDEHV